MLAKGNLTVIALLLSCVLLGPAFARADTITTFDVSGRFDLGSFSGTLTVDTDLGRITGVNITVSRYDPFVILTFSYPRPYSQVPGFNWAMGADNIPKNPNQPRPDGLSLDFGTSPTAASLVGFTGGTIVDGDLLCPFSGRREICGSYFSGSITPAVSVGTNNVPEPSSLALLALGLACLPFGFARKKASHNLRNRLPHPGSDHTG